MPFPRQPTLTAGHLRVRPLTAADRPALRAAASDPLIWAQHNDPGRYGPTVDRYFDDNLASGGGLVIEDLNWGEVIGHTRYQLLPDADDVVEVGWTFLTRAYWGTGANLTVKRLLVAHAAAHRRRVVLHIQRDNTRSRKAAEQLGGVLLTAGQHDNWQSKIADFTSYALPEVIT